MTETFVLSSDPKNLALEIDNLKKRIKEIEDFLKTKKHLQQVVDSKQNEITTLKQALDKAERRLKKLKQKQ